MKKLLVGLIILLVVIAGFMIVRFLNSGSSQPPTTSQNNQIVFDGSKFVPDNLKIKAGEKVVWKNQGSETVNIESNPHPIHTSYKPLNLGALTPGNQIDLTFDKPGVYNYHNHLNPTQKGSITVE